MASEVQVGFLESLEKGDMLRVDRDGVYDHTTALRYVHEDGYVYGKVRGDAPTTDGDGDIKVDLCKPTGQPEGKTAYFGARDVEVANRSPERDIDHRISADESDNETSDVLDTLDDRSQNVLQMENLAAATVEPGLFRLPCSVVTTTDDSARWSVEVTHPTKGDIIFHIDKPMEEGWVEGQELVDLLKWYDIFDHDVYKLQVRHLYVAYTGSASDTPHGYELVEPPQGEPPQPTHWDAFKYRLATARESLSFDRSVEKSWFLLGLSTILMAIGTALLLPGVGAAGFTSMLVIGLVAYIIMTMLTLGATEPPGGD